MKLHYYRTLRGSVVVDCIILEDARVDLLKWTYRWHVTGKVCLNAVDCLINKEQAATRRTVKRPVVSTNGFFGLVAT